MLEKERKIVIYLSKIAKTREETVFLFLSKNAKNVFIFNFFKEISSFVLLVRAAQCLGIRSGIGGQRTFHIFTLSFFLSFFRVLSFYFQKLSLLNGFSVCASVAYFLVVNHT